ncbi:MAG: glycosyltransferase family 1 protein, partial [Rhodospirillales bacterium]
VLYVATLLSLFTCRRAIAVSEYACHLGGGAVAAQLRKRIQVVPHGVDKIYSQLQDANSRKSFLLSVSDIYVQKNFTNLIQALTKLKESFPDIKLKIAGEPVDQDYYETLKRQIEIEDLAEQIEFLGYVPPKALCELYRACAVFVFPSTVETFGNPLVEAMACGAPIASSKSTAMPEVLGDAGLYFDPEDVDDIAATIKSMLLDKKLCNTLSQKAEIRSKQFAWELTMDKTMTALRDQTPL